MILTLGVLAATMTATPLQPYNVNKMDNVVTRVYIAHDTMVHLSHTSRLEVVIDKGGKVVKAEDGAKSIDVKAKQGTTLNISVLTGWNKDTYYKIGSQVVNVRGFKNVGF